VCLCGKKGKSDHVTSLIHPPPGLMYAAGQRNGRSGPADRFEALLYNNTEAFLQGSYGRGKPGKVMEF